MNTDKLPILIVLQTQAETIATMNVRNLASARVILLAIGGDGSAAEVDSGIVWANSPIGVGNGYLGSYRFTITNREAD